MPMKDLPQDQRPREKLLARGPAALADTELLALLLRTGLPGQGVFVLAEQVLKKFGGMAGLLQASADDMRAIKGLGPAKRAELAAVMEMARRALAQQMQAVPIFETPQQVKDYVALQLGGKLHEVFAVMFLDGHHRLLAFEELFQGSLAQTSVYPREVVKRALALNAAAVILAHNHPSGVAEPSRADDSLTITLRDALRLVEVKVIDHLVVGHGTVFSFAESGKL